MAKGDGIGLNPGALRTGARARTFATEGPIVLQLTGRLAARVRQLAKDSGAASVESYCEQIMEWFVVEHRSGKDRLDRVDPLRHASRHNDEWEAE